MSVWLKSAPSDPPTSSSSSSSGPTSVKVAAGVSETRDRLLHSEIRELQAKRSQLEKENHELRQLLKASGDDSRAALLTRQVKTKRFLCAFTSEDVCITVLRLAPN